MAGGQDGLVRVWCLRSGQLLCTSSLRPRASLSMALQAGGGGEEEKEREDPQRSREPQQRRERSAAEDGTPVVNTRRLISPRGLPHRWLQVGESRRGPAAAAAGPCTTPAAQLTWIEGASTLLVAAEPLALLTIK